jgi:bidirectional [NiFe] hydrogenase diaphorase subunit
VTVSTARPAAPSDDKRWKAVDTRMRQLGNRPDALVEALHAVQEAFGYIDEEALHYLSRSLSVPPSTVYGVATFYHYFRLEPEGRHTAVVCTGTACYIDGAAELLEAAHSTLGVRPNETTPDGRLSVSTARCIGACSLAPAVIIDGEVKGRVGAEEFVNHLEKGS